MDGETIQVMEALSNAEEFDIFNAEPVKMLVSTLFEPVKKQVIRKLLVPYFVFLLVFDIFGNYLRFEQIDIFRQREAAKLIHAAYE